MSEHWNERDRERLLAEMRCRSLELRLELAHLDHLGLLLRDGMIQPWGARAAFADLCGDVAERGEQ